MKRLEVKVSETIPFKGDPYKAWARNETFYATSYWDCGGLRYFRTDPFNVKCVGIEDIVSMKEVA